ncbi:MAG: AMP-binding protein, partial [Acidimicrobiales bacterium]
MELPLTPLDFLARARRLFPDREAIFESGAVWTYGAFAERCDRLAHALQGELGVRPGDVVAWLCGNTHELLEAYYGVLLAGGTLRPLKIRLWQAELRAFLDDSHAVVLFRHPDQVDPGHTVRTVILGDEHEALLARQPADPPPTPPVDE